MLQKADWANLTDPVCGRSVEATSPHRVIHGGALFAFCSPACKSQFVDLPSRYAVIATAAQARPERERDAVPAPAPSHAAPAAPAPAAAAPAAAATPRPVKAGAAAAAAALLGPLPDAQALGGGHGPFSWLLAWRERRFAAQCARDMLKLHHSLSSRYPELKGQSLYRRVVAARLNDDDLAAEAVLQHAEQSFAIWPVERALNFRDVVHYLAVSQFMAKHHGARWVYADMRRIVDALIPQHL